MAFVDFLSSDKLYSENEVLELFFSNHLYFSPEEKSKIQDAWKFLCKNTVSIKTRSKKPYYYHAVRVASTLAERQLDYQCIIAGFLHNILAFSDCKEEVVFLFGEEVEKIIVSTARITKLKIQNKTLHQADSMRKMLFAMVDDIRVILIMLADRLDRIRNLADEDAIVQKQVSQEIIDIWAPLANRIGISSVKSELEDLSLKYLNPDAYLQIKKIVASKKQERADYLDKAVKEIHKSAARAGIEVSISSRAKHFYSIYQKMKKRNKGAEELFDLLALRVLCNTQAECYTLLGIVHGLWKPMDGRFKDYIAMPKANGYRSLHTTVIYEGRPLEVQIRTHEMHSVAEFGVASHWLYKKGTNHDEVNISSLSIINQLRQLQKEHLNDERFFAEIKEELLGDSIFVFTPKGEVIELPRGATAVDFAYHIHSAIGEKITGAKADGHIIPLSKSLKNTQIVEILTSPQAHPSQNQLEFVKTAKARSKIRSWLAQHDPTYCDYQNPAGGKSISEQENPTTPPRSHKRGTGSAPSVPKVTGTGKIRIGKTTNFLVKKAGCCNPEFGDEIIGYVSRGRGIIIHRADCSVFARIPNSAAQSLAVEWDVAEDKRE